MSEERDVIDGLLKQPNLLSQYLYDKGIFGIDPETIPTPDDTRGGRS